MNCASFAVALKNRAQVRFFRIVVETKDRACTMQMQLACWCRPEINILMSMLFPLACITARSSAKSSTIHRIPEICLCPFMSFFLLPFHNIRVVIDRLLNFCWIPFGEKSKLLLQIDSQNILNIALYWPPSRPIDLACWAHDVNSFPASTKLLLNHALRHDPPPA